jgi:RNA polymerase sigma-70 factor (ECF subfamily)
VTDKPVDVGGPDDSTSTTWLDRVRSGEPGAWESFANLYAPLIYHWCQRCGLQPADAADIGQDVFRAVLAAIGSFRRQGSGSFRGWLRVITRNKVRDLLRERLKVPGAGGGNDQHLIQIAVDSDPGTDDVPDPEEERILYCRALELVLADHREETREVFMRVVVDRQDPSAVAADLGLSLNAVYLIKSRVLRRLRDEFRELLDPGSG